VGRDHDDDEGDDRTPDPAEPRDEDLLAAWRAGCRKSGEVLWRRHARSVQRFFRNKVPWAVAMDLSQRTLMACLRAQGEIRSFRSYLLGIATHQLFDYLRAEKRKQRHDTDLEGLSVEEAFAASPEEWVGDKREKRVLLRALRRLPLTHQLVLELRYWERLSDRDIAEVLAWPAGTVKSRLKAGKRALGVEIHRLEASPDQQRSTADTFEQWAGRTRGMIGHPPLPAVERVRAAEGEAPTGIDLAQGSGAISLPAPGGGDLGDDSDDE
jgi:RNA polymerase sigma-70 factor, ECF subfamily